jgi:predicted transcriptional regulator
MPETAGRGRKRRVTAMVLILIPPPVLGISETDVEAIFDLLQARGGLASSEVAGALRMDEAEVAIYLANQAGLGNLAYRGGEYSVTSRF